MKVKIGTYTLAGEGDEQTSGLRITAERAMQPGRYPGAGTIDTFDRGNRQVSIAFRVTRKHLTLMDAEHFMFKHLVDCPPSGDVVFTTVASNGSVQEIKLPNAVIVAFEEEPPIGLSTFHNYRIVGGALEYQGVRVTWPKPS